MRGPLWRLSAGALSWRVRSAWSEIAPGVLSLSSTIEDDLGFEVEPRDVAQLAGLSPVVVARALRAGAILADRERARSPLVCPVVLLPRGAAVPEPIVEVSP